MPKLNLLYVCLLAIQFAGLPLATAELGKDSQEALEKTQTLLRDPTQRNAAINQNQDARSNDAELQKLMGGKGADGVYDLSADIFAKIVNESNGDVVVMQQKIEQVQKNPEAFLKSLTPEQQARIKSMANQSGDKRGPSNKP